MFAKPLICAFISVFVVALVYSSISGFNVFAAPKEAPSSAECKEYSTSNAVYGFFTVTDCCWTETDPNDPEGIELYWCQSCTQNGCSEKRPASQGPTPPPPGPVAPLQGGVLEQLQNDQPPLFGRNEAAVPPTGGIEQPFTTTTPPLFGNIPQGGGFGVLQESETPPTFGQVAPLTDEEEAQVQEPDEQISEEDGQVIAKDEDEDDDDGPVPPECPTTGPIPPDCTLKPKFPDERAIE